MKNLFVLVLFSFFVASCSNKTTARYISVVEKETTGLIVVEADGVGSSNTQRIQSAQKHILQEVIFHGVPSSATSDLRLPLIDSKSTLDKQQQKSLERLIAPENVDKYFTSFSAISKTKFQGKLRIDLLRSDLEKNNIIRSFGY